MPVEFVCSKRCYRRADCCVPVHGLLPAQPAQIWLQAASLSFWQGVKLYPEPFSPGLPNFGFVPVLSALLQQLWE